MNKVSSLINVKCKYKHKGISNKLKKAATLMVAAFLVFSTRNDYLTIIFFVTEFSPNLTV